MVERTNSNAIILAPQGMQENAQSTKIDFTSEYTSSDEELEGIIQYAIGV